MDQLLALCALVGAAAITPGPNNLVVLHAAGHAGLRGALPSIIGIVLGGLLLLAALASGVDAAFATWPTLRRGIGIIGASYLVWLGAVLMARGIAASDGNPETTQRDLPTGMLALLGFQFLNPKSWVMVLTALTTLPVIGAPGYVLLAAIFTVIPSFCLLIWAALGASLARWLAQRWVRRSVDSVMGVVLVVCAAALLLANP